MNNDSRNWQLDPEISHMLERRSAWKIQSASSRSRGSRAELYFFSLSTMCRAATMGGDARHCQYSRRNPQDNLLGNWANKGRQCGPARDAAQRCSTLMYGACRSLGQCTGIGQVLTWNERIMAMSGIWCQYPGSGSYGAYQRACSKVLGLHYIYARSVVKIKRYIDMRIGTGARIGVVGLARKFTDDARVLFLRRNFPISARAWLRKLIFDASRCFNSFRK